VREEEKGDFTCAFSLLQSAKHEKEGRKLVGILFCGGCCGSYKAHTGFTVDASWGKYVKIICENSKGTLFVGLS
jgi:hypothetical protein